MLAIHFGEFRYVRDRHGQQREVGEWALHFQCPWRFVRRNSIILASTDVHSYPEAEESYDFNQGGENLFDRRAQQFNRVLDTGVFRISEIICGPCGAFQLTFTRDLHFAVFPAASDGSPYGEFWRLFQPDSEQSHYVVTTEGIESD